MGGGGRSIFLYCNLPIWKRKLVVCPPPRFLGKIFFLPLAFRKERTVKCCQDFRKIFQNWLGRQFDGDSLWGTVAWMPADKLNVFWSPNTGFGLPNGWNWKVVFFSYTLVIQAIDSSNLFLLGNTFLWQIKITTSIWQ